MNFEQFENRKRDHLQHALDPKNQALGLTGLSQISLLHEASPELDFADIKINTKCLNKDLATPFFISGMTAGHPQAQEINQALAVACQKRGWGFGLGSQRRELESGDFTESLKLRAQFPSLFLIANIGATQVDGQSHRVSMLCEWAQALRPQALAVHFNALQEALQPEGTPHFKGVEEQLKKLCEKLQIPVVLKETGCGFSEPTLRRLNRVGFSAVDLSGLGGTHWGRIEGKRSDEQSVWAKAAKTFENWGISTVQSVLNAREAQWSGEVWASGGVRTGLDAAKLIAMGANRVGYAQPALQVLMEGGSVEAWMEHQETELKIALFCTGSLTPDALRESASRKWYVQ